MNDLQVIAWCIFVLMSGLLGFGLGIFFERDKANHTIVEEFLNEQDQEKKQISRDIERVLNSRATSDITEQATNWAGSGPEKHLKH